MVQVCKGICKRHEAPSIPNFMRYISGQKRCTLCSCFFVTTKITCICCMTKLRNGPRSKKRT